MSPVLGALKPRERRLTLVAGLLIGCWMLISLIVQPLWDRTRALRLHIETQRERLEGLERVVTRRGAIEQDYQRLAGYLATEPDAQGELLNDLETLSRQAGLHLNLKPKPTRRDREATRLEVELDSEGGQEALLGFLDAVMRMPRLLVVERLRLSTVPGKGTVRMDLLLQQLLPPSP